jgi:hypothetical protein
MRARPPLLHVNPPKIESSGFDECVPSNAVKVDLGIAGDGTGRTLQFSDCTPTGNFTLSEARCFGFCLVRLSGFDQDGAAIRVR